MSFPNTTRLSTPPMADVVAETGLTYRQLDYAVRRGLLHPIHRGGTGTPRVWPTTELDVASRMAAYLRAGLTLDAAHHAARHDGTLPGGHYEVRPTDPDDEPDRLPLVPAQRTASPDTCVPAWHHQNDPEGTTP